MNRPREPRSVFRMASFRLAVLGTLFSSLGAVVIYALIYTETSHAAHAEFGPIVATERAELLAHIPCTKSRPSR